MEKEVKTYILTMTEDQARALSNAAELVSRLHMGQLDCLRQFTRYPNDNHEEIYKRLDEMRELMGLIPPGFGRNAFYGISSPDITNTARTLFDIYQVIRHEIWKNQKDAPNYITHASPAMQFDHTQELPKILSKNDSHA
jgi:hypothetical protein